MRLLVDLVRTAATLLVGLIVTYIASVMVTVLGRLRPHSPTIDRVARWWSRSWLAAARVELTVNNGDLVDPSRSYVVVANHRSALDIMACFLALPIPIRFLAKKELFRIPIFGTAMRSIGIVEVDRRAPTALHDQINQAAWKLIEADRSLIIYPEGTRSAGTDLVPRL